MRRHSSLYLIAIALVSALLTLPCLAQQLPVGPLIELSRPNAVGSCNDGFNLFGTWPTDDTAEPFVVVNPAQPNNIVAAWIQGGPSKTSSPRSLSTEAAIGNESQYL